MNRTIPTPSLAFSPTKLAIITVLAIVLVVVVAVQFSGRESVPAASQKKTSRNVPGAATETAVTTSATMPAVRLHWPEIQREEVTAFNPFEIPDGLLPKSLSTSHQAQSSQSIQVAQSLQTASPQPTATGGAHYAGKTDDAQGRIRAQERKSRIKSIATILQQQGVGVVVSTSAGSVARIGEQEVRVGDIINGVLRVVEIGPQGIVIEEAPEDSTDDRNMSESEPGTPSK